MIVYNISNDPFEFDTDKNGFPALTENNVKRINFLIKNDSNYTLLDDRYEDSISKTINSHRFATQYDEIFDIVKVIDQQNSTHLSVTGIKGKEGKGRDLMSLCICDLITKSGFYDSLRASNPEIVNYIAKNAIETRNTFSFASKFCTYMARALFKGEKEEDNYSIFDSVMCDALPYYAWVYLRDDRYIKRKCSAIPEMFAAKGNGKYKEYRNLIDEIRAAARDNVLWDTASETNSILSEMWDKRPRKHHISRKDFDHLLWYYFKGSSKKKGIKEALECVGKEDTLLK